MTIAAAKKFITRGQNDPQLRDRLNGAAAVADLWRILEEEGLPFSPAEFEEAYGNRLTTCRFQEQADQLASFKLWWDLLHAYCGDATGPQTGCAATAHCAAGGCRGCC